MSRTGDTVTPPLLADASADRCKPPRTSRARSDVVVGLSDGAEREYHHRVGVGMFSRTFLPSRLYRRAARLINEAIPDTEVTVELPVLQSVFDQGVGELQGSQSLQ